MLKYNRNTTSASPARPMASVLLWLALLLPLHSLAQPEEIKLPVLGDATSGLVSIEQERALGQTWLRMFRSRVPTLNDPLIYNYLEDLLYQLATYSQLVDKRLELVVVENETINAFAVPGGVIGVHTGLFLHANSEAQLSAVLAHELAHLSQRHFARGVEAAKRNALPNMAALLASLILAATTSGDAGIAALTATQAANIQSQLTFSRQNESEADRLGIQTMVKAGMDPEESARMFENMLRSLRYAGRRPPEFLLTHPVTEKRIADARNRASQYKKIVGKDTIEFHLMKARIAVDIAENPNIAVKHFRAALDGDTSVPDAERYGLALALIQTGQFEEAQQLVEQLLAKDSNRISYQLAQVDVLNAQGQYEKSVALLEETLKINPDNFPLSYYYAETLLKLNDYRSAETVLKALSKQRPKDPSIWYLLAETHGLAGNILGVHQARAEFFLLNGILDKAQKQLGYALKLTADHPQLAARIEQRLREIQEMKKQAM